MADSQTDPLNQLIARRLGPGADTGRGIDMPDSVELVLRRRSERRYKPDPVPDAILDVLMACYGAGPSKSDLQQTTVIAIRDAGKRARANALLKDPWIAGAPAFLVCCGDTRRNREITRLRGYSYANDNVDAFMNAAVDTGIAMQNLILAARGFGIGCCPISQVRNHIDAFTEMLALPEGVFPVCGLTVAYFEPGGPLSPRLPLDAVAHTDAYDDETWRGTIDAYDERRHGGNWIPPEKQRHVDRYGPAEKCGWSENLARQQSVPERPGFRAYLKKQGYSLG